MGLWPSVEMRGREERREVHWRGNAQLFQALEKGPWIWELGEILTNTLESWGSGCRWAFCPRGRKDILRNCFRLRQQNWRPVKFVTAARVSH